MKVWSQYRREQIRRGVEADMVEEGFGDTEATQILRSWAMDPDLFEQIEDARAMAPAFKDQATLMAQCNLDEETAETIWVLAQEQWKPGHVAELGVIATGVPSPSWLVPAAVGVGVVVAVLGVAL